MLPLGTSDCYYGVETGGQFTYNHVLCFSAKICIVFCGAKTLQEPLTASVSVGQWAPMMALAMAVRGFVTQLQSLTRLSRSLCCMNRQEVGPGEHGCWGWEILQLI